MDEDLREPLVRRQGSQVYMRVARGSAHTVSQDGLGAWEGGLITKGAPAWASPGRKCLSLSVTRTFFTSGQYALFSND